MDHSPDQLVGGSRQDPAALTHKHPEAVCCFEQQTQHLRDGKYQKNQIAFVFAI